ncbi:MAG: shikimate dehydrogenase [Muribaculaceae bacterium]|nr:shikimate dehydrogenase [Muribaculaceae bacterium]
MARKQIYGLLGRKLGHSFSRAYFMDKFAREGIDAEYLNFELPDIDGLPQLLAQHPGLRGFNVTIPYKQAVMPMLASLDESARRVGAVNVVRVETDGSLRGFNTDAQAFAVSLGRLLAGRPKPAGALVLGTGGASLAVNAALRGMGIVPQPVSRTPGKGILSYQDLTPEVMAAHTLVVNATPLGTFPKCDEAPGIPYDALTPAHACFDLVYNPDPTLFMRLAAARGAAACSGLEMLQLQADASWRIWQDTLPRS